MRLISYKAAQPWLCKLYFDDIQEYFFFLGKERNTEQQGPELVLKDAACSALDALALSAGATVRTCRVTISYVVI